MNMNLGYKKLEITIEHLEETHQIIGKIIVETLYLRIMNGNQNISFGLINVHPFLGA